VPQQTLLDTSRTGQFTFTVAATDASAYRTTVTATYTVVDKTPPTVSFQAPLLRQSRLPNGRNDRDELLLR